MYLPTPDGLAAALAALGNTAEQVAETLARAGFSGHRGDEASCPIAWYLRSTIPSVTDAYAGLVNPPCDDRQRAGICLPDGAGWVDIAMPQGPAAFVIAFDDGSYDELARERDESTPTTASDTSRTGVLAR